MRSVGWFLLATVAGGGLEAQKVQLELRPRAGDTLRMRLEQTTEVSGTRLGATPLQVTTTLRMYSRAIVESATAAAATILAVTDSVSVTTSDEHAKALADQTRRQLQGRTMRLLLMPDGTVTVAGETKNVPKEVNDLISVMPASFPKLPIMVGDTWMREMPIPPGARLGLPLGGLVRARFRLDSVSRDGEYAFVSMRGQVQPAGGAPSARADTADAVGGAVNGTMTVNRKRGWLSESRFQVQMRTTVPSPGVVTGAPMRFRMKITQHMRIVDRRSP
jgi:hypothetical protein